MYLDIKGESHGMALAILREALNLGRIRCGRLSDFAQIVESQNQHTSQEASNVPQIFL